MPATRSGSACNSPAFVAAYFGALQLGAVVVPLNMLLAAPEIHNPISDGKTPLLGVDVWEHAYYL